MILPKRKFPDNVIRLKYPYYIKCMNSLNFAIYQVRGYKSKDGEKDMAIYYASSLRDIIHVAINHSLCVPADVETIMHRIDKLHEIVDKKFPDVIKAEVAEKWFKEGLKIG